MKIYTDNTNYILKEYDNNELNIVIKSIELPFPTLEEIEEVCNNHYIVKRIKEYKTLEEQLDMIYWDKLNGTDLWKSHIDNIKLKYPKN